MPLACKVEMSHFPFVIGFIGQRFCYRWRTCRCAFFSKSDWLLVCVPCCFFVQRFAVASSTHLAIGNRMTRGQDGLLLLSCIGLSPTIACQFVLAHLFPCLCSSHGLTGTRASSPQADRMSALPVSILELAQKVNRINSDKVNHHVGFN